MTTPSVAQTADWLAMLFLGADHDLSEFGTALLKEAARVGSSDRVIVVAERDPTDPFAPTMRGKLTRGDAELKELVGVTAGDPQTIADFVIHAKKTFPAQKALLVLWDHGNGWQNVHDFEPVVRVSGIVKQHDAGGLRVKDLRGAFDQCGVGVVGFDSCLMAMIEIAYELRNTAELMVASENVVPADSGWPYDKVLRALTSNPDMTSESLACTIVDLFGSEYFGSAEPVALSAIRLSSEVDDAVKAIDVLARQLIDGLTTCRREILFARRYCQSFANTDYIDIVSFCEELQRLLPNTEIANAAGEVIARVRCVVIRRACSGARSIARANGLSIYFPDRPMAESYAKLEFAKARNCLWAQFIERVAPKRVAPRPLMGKQMQQMKPATNVVPMPGV